MEREKQTILIVEDQQLNRQILCHILEDEYDVAQAADGREALAYWENHAAVAAVLLDIVMPVMDGYAFLQAVREAGDTSLPVIAVTADRDEASEQRALDLGAWDFISKPYQPRILLARLKNVIIRSQFYLVNEMQYAYEHDPLTDLYNRAAFFSHTRKLLDSHPDIRFAIARFDIDGFHLLNSFWGEEEGNRFLRYIADGVRKTGALMQPCTFARINADTFCFCVPYDDAKIRYYLNRARRLMADFNRNYQIIPSLGVYEIADPAEKIEAMYEKATLAALQCKGNYLVSLCYYEPAMSEKARQEQWIIGQMQAALDGGQFEVFLQPKYNLTTMAPYGAEALIRWRHPERGLLPPGLFIPVFESNGFIGKVDHYMWDKVCQLLRRWLDEGKDPAPISVNVSRVNLYNPNLVSVLTGLVEKYQIPPRLLNLELTESAYMDNPSLMENTVLALRRAGFVIMMDDFGSGYSSLNTLKEISVDVLKIDMKFLSGNGDDARNECILASVVRMAGWLEIPVVMEGVETAEQVEYLKSIGCGYVQGYFFARPMPVADFEQLVAGVRQIPAASLSQNHQEMFRTIWPASPEVTLLFESIRHPAAILEYDGRTFYMLRTNGVFNRVFGYGRANGGDSRFADDHLPDGGQEKLLDAIAQTARSRGEAGCAYTFRFADGHCATVRASLRYWGKNEKTDVVFGVFMPQPPAR